MWYKKLISIVLFLSIIYLIINFPSEAYTPVKSPLHHGNTESNLANGGFATYDGEWIYYSDNSGIWKVKNDNSSKTNISSDTGRCLNVLDGFLYYCTSGKDAGIYKINTDGTDKSKICNDNADNLNLIGTTLYYINRTSSNDNDSIWKADINGQNRKCIVNNSHYLIDNLITSENTLYYKSKGTLTKINIDGTRKLFVTSDSVDNFTFSSDSIYYCGGGIILEPQGLYKMKPNGHNKVLLIQDVNCFNIQGNTIFYEKLKKPSSAFTTAKTADGGISISTNGKVPSSLYKMNTDGNNSTKIIDAPIYEMNVAGNWIFYITHTENSKNHLYKIKVDGTEMQQIE